MKKRHVYRSGTGVIDLDEFKAVCTALGWVVHDLCDQESVGCRGSLYDNLSNHAKARVWVAMIVVGAGLGEDEVVRPGITGCVAVVKACGVARVGSCTTVYVVKATVIGPGDGVSNRDG